jgi:cholesterol transport system auxiliary component
MNTLAFVRSLRFCAAALGSMLVGGCGALLPAAPPLPFVYSLQSARAESQPATPEASTLAIPAPTLVVDPPRAAAGFESRHIIYVREPHQLEYFAHSEWVDTPARMLAPLIIAAVGNRGKLRAVVSTASGAAGDVRLDTEILRLQQDFTGPTSRARFTLRAYIVDSATRRVLAWREFDESVASASEDPYGGVIAANRAVQTVLKSLAGFCAEAAGYWKASTTTEGVKNSAKQVGR